MPLKDRFRKAIRRSDRSGSISSSSASSSNTTPISSVPQSGAATPTPAIPTLSSSPTSSSPPLITLTKTNTSSRLSLTKTLTWGRRLTPEEKEQKKLDEWRKRDAEAWDLPHKRYSSRHKSKAHQDVLRAFEWKLRDVRESFDGRRPTSLWSGVSPGQSRVGSVDSGCIGGLSAGGRKRSSAAGLGMGPLSREVSMTETLPPNRVDAVLEE